MIRDSDRADVATGKLRLIRDGSYQIARANSATSANTDVDKPGVRVDFASPATTGLLAMPGFAVGLTAATVAVPFAFAALVVPSIAFEFFGRVWDVGFIGDSMLCPV